MRIIDRIIRALVRNRRRELLEALPPGARVLDVGCGNDSAYHAKQINPGLFYHGVDVGDYNMAHPESFDVYDIVSAGEFARFLERMDAGYDLVISNHNIEHCLYPNRVVDAMCRLVKPGGMLYIAFPAEDSIGFPGRDGCLNFFDDCTHDSLPSTGRIRDALRENGLAVLEEACPRQPRGEYWLGFFFEPWSVATRRVMPGTWAFWGFENMLLASRPDRERGDAA